MVLPVALWKEPAAKVSRHKGKMTEKEIEIETDTEREREKEGRAPYLIR